jgi:hypothetical protein
MALAGQACFRHVRGMSAEHDAIAQAHMAQLQGLEESGK